VAAIRHGHSIRWVARRFSVGRRTVERWVLRAGDQRLDRVDWSDGPCGPHCPANRVAAAVEVEILRVRQKLEKQSDLGEFGEAAIHRELLAGDYQPLPSVRTIGRVLLRRGVLDYRRRIRHPAPPRGWYLPRVAQGQAELDSFDIVSGLVLKGGIDVEVLNTISLHGGLVGSWVRHGITATETVHALIEHWRQFGLPSYAQFDNDSRFHGTHRWPNSLGRVARVCLSLGVVPVFVPPREPGFQAAIESYNGRWQAKVWARFQYPSLAAVQNQSARYVSANRQRFALRQEAAPPRAVYPDSWRLTLHLPSHGRVIFLRRTDHKGRAALLGHSFHVDPLWPHRLVRGEIDLHSNLIHFYALRRREPGHQPILAAAPCQLPPKPFQGRPLFADGPS